jgi:mono/diheme cytochrome c family protein
MGRWTKILLWSVVTVVVLLAVAITATIGWRPFIGPATRPLTDRKFEVTAARMERGRYLFTSVTPCALCHTDRDYSIDGRPAKAGMEMSGHNWADEELPWLNAPNVTPDKETGAGTWTDDMFARAIREGIGHDGRTLFPVMPYAKFSGMSDEDLASIIVYVRSLPAVSHVVSKTEIPFPPGPLINGLPQPITAPVPAPDLSTPVKRGEYLVRLAVCADCHSTADAQGNAVPGMDFAGGTLLPDKVTGRTVASQNITQDPSGIPYYDEALFLNVMRSGKVIARELDDMMPWGFYGKMTDDDLKDIWAYLKSLPPVKHRVDNSKPATLCPVCKLTHGGGDTNVAPGN